MERRFWVEDSILEMRLDFFERSSRLMISVESLRV